MSDTAFDTLAAARKLKAARVEPEQAEAIADAIGAADGGGSLVTKDHLDKRLAALETRLVNRLYAAIGIAVGVTIAAFKLL